ncbi:hypothetical protein ACTA71_000071 [Dictyostelium dimigraforme]
MKYLITIFLLLNLITIIKSQPRCLFNDIYSNNQNLKPSGGEDYVDWWIYEHFNKVSASVGGSSFYTDSNLKANEIILELKDYDMRSSSQVSPITKTYSQISNPLFSSIAYNNGFKDEYTIGSAHEKGFFIWNELGGIHVIHSIPVTPQTVDTFFLSTSVDNYLQHSVCISLKKEELDIIPKFLIYTNPVIAIINSKLISYTLLSQLNSDTIVNGISNIDSTKDLTTVTDAQIGTKRLFTDIDTIIANNFIVSNTLPRSIKIFQWAKLAKHIAGNWEFTSDLNHRSLHYYKMKTHSFGDYFVQTSIPEKSVTVHGTSARYLGRMNNIEILWQYIGKYYTGFSSWTSQTMTSNKGFAATEHTGTNFLISLRLNYPFLKGKQQRSASKDHSKLMYGTSDDGTRRIICLGGLNWQYVQESRGGAAFCMSGIGYLADYMNRHVSWTRRGITSDIAKFGVPHSTMGTEIDFSWIKNQLIASGLGFSMGFEITVPTTTQPKRLLIEPSIADYKTNKAPILIKLDTLQNIYKTESISINVFPSVEGRVHMCPPQTQCTYESSIKLNLVSNLNLIVTATQATAANEPQMTISTVTPNPVINVSPDVKSYYFSSLVAEKIVHKSGNNNTGIYLIKTAQSIEDFKFVFGPINTIANCEFIIDNSNPNFSILNLAFHQTCIDQLVFCLFRVYNANVYNNRNVFVADDQGSFYNDVTYILNDLIPTIPSDIARCIPQPPPPGSNDPTSMSDNNAIMGSNSMSDI